MAIAATAQAPTNTGLATDASLAPFLSDAFDAADYLNSALPSWPSQASISTARPASSNALAQVNTQAQTLIAQLSAQLNRLSATLSRLSDEILRSGSRLAYEVEVLRGDAATLGDALTGDLRRDIARFVPEPAHAPVQRPPHSRARSRHLSVASAALSPATPRTHNDEQLEPPKPTAQTQDPAAAELQRLQTLSLVRDRLDSVIKVFGAALEWAVPPSEVSIKSSFISVAGPDADADAIEARETKGRQFAERTRAELAEMLARDRGEDGEGYRAALARIEQFRELALVWQGTAEEKARTRFVDSLAKLVDEKRKSGRVTTAAGSGSGYSVRNDPSHRR